MDKDIARLSPALSKEDEEIWQQWVDETRMVEDLLSQSVREVFKRRAIFLLIASRGEWIPFYHTYFERGAIRDYEFLKLLSPSLVKYTAEVGCTFYELEVTHKKDANRFVIRGYNRLMLRLLEVLPQKDAEKVFLHFSIHCHAEPRKDIFNYDDFEEFRALLHSERNIDECWKRRADEQMRLLLQGGTHELIAISDENMFEYYTGIVNHFLYNKNDPCYSLGLLAEQLDFLLDVLMKCDIPKNIAGLRSCFWRWDEFYTLFSDASFRGIRRKFANCIATTHRDWVSYAEKLLAVQNMIDEFAEDDPSLVAQLRKILAEGQKQYADERREIEEYNHKEKERATAYRKLLRKMA